MESFNQLKAIFSKLNKPEIQLVYKLLEIGIESMPDAGLKSAILLETIGKKNDISAIDMQKILYKQANYEAFNKLVKRTRDKISEVLIMDLNIARGETYVDRNKTLFMLHKKIISSLVQEARGLAAFTGPATELLIKSALEYEFFDMALYIYQHKLNLMAFRKSELEVAKAIDQIKSIEIRRASLLNSSLLYNQLMAHINQSASYHDYQEKLPEYIEKFEKDYQQSNAGTIAYYKFFTQTEYYQNKREYKFANKALLAIKKLLAENVAVYTKQRMGTLLINLANNQLYLKNFTYCYELTDQAIDYYQNSNINKGVSLEIKFFGKFYESNFDDARLIIEELYNNPIYRSINLINQKRAFYLASLYFKMQSFDKALNLMDAIKDLSNDREGWNISKRILSILIEIEKGDLDEVDNGIQSMKLHIKRTLKNKYISMRYITIMRILVKLFQSGFDFELTYQSRKRYFELMAQDPAYQWQMKSPELVNFEEWFNSKR
ncbi:MAG: hypothetical protein RIQ89_799 [Bacteroidota bacterium]